MSNKIEFEKAPLLQIDVSKQWGVLDDASQELRRMSRLRHGQSREARESQGVQTMVLYPSTGRIHPGEIRELEGKRSYPLRVHEERRQGKQIAVKRLEMLKRRCFGMYFIGMGFLL